MYEAIRPARRRGAFRPDAIAVVLLEDTRSLPAGYAELDRSTDGALTAALRRPEVSLAEGAITTLYPSRGPARLYVLGLGPREAPAARLRAAAARLLKAADAARVRRLLLAPGPGLSDALAPEQAGAACGDGLAIAGFAFEDFKSAAAGRKRGGSLSVRIDDEDMARSFVRALQVGESVNLARTLAATPPNVAHPAWLSSFCRRMARDVGLRCSVIDAARARRLGMGGLGAVGAAGSTPPALICLEHRPPAPKRSGPRGRRPGPIMLVGKAITFDTGGYSIKTATGMDGMKYDKCGGTAVIGAMHAIARLKLNQHVVGLVPAAENMIDQTSYRPGDILKMYNGTTVEVTNTDAEGRLVLADALAYGCRTYRPRAIVDLATLTGGVVVALGTVCAGAFCNDADWRRHLFDAAEYTGERLWHLPLWPEHKALLKSTHADIVNSGPREAHASQGAAFLAHFVDADTPWAHLDIAGVADRKKDDELHARGPTGFGVRLLARAVETSGEGTAAREEGTKARRSKGRSA